MATETKFDPTELTTSSTHVEEALENLDKLYWTRNEQMTRGGYGHVAAQMADGVRQGKIAEANILLRSVRELLRQAR